MNILCTGILLLGGVVGSNQKQIDVIRTCPDAISGCQNNVTTWTQLTLDDYSAVPPKNVVFYSYTYKNHLGVIVENFSSEYATIDGVILRYRVIKDRC